MRLACLFCVLLLSLQGCNEIPQDLEGTFDRVRGSRSFSVGVITGSEAVSPDKQEQFLRGVAQSTGARPVLESGAAEPLLLKLEKGELDLVIGAMAAKSSWSKKVHFLPPLQKKYDPAERLSLVAMSRNGENRWIYLLHQRAVEVGGGK